MQTASNHTHLPEIRIAMLVLAMVVALLATLALARPAAAEEVLIADKTVQVPENVPGDGRQDFDTGVDVQTGDRILVGDTGLRDLVLARGVVYPAGRLLARFWPPTGPAGYGSDMCMANNNFPLSSAPCFSLLGKLDGQYFYIGGSKDWVHQGSPDRLRMIVNDDAPGNGEGYFEVRIQVLRDIPLPDTTITSGPTGVINTDSAVFGFSSDRGVGFQCKLDGGAFEDCSSPKGYTSLPNGQHTFYVKATDQYGRPDPIPDQRTWIVDRVAPGGSVVVNGGAAYTRRATVNLTLAASDPSPGSGVSSMRISNDGSTWSAWEPYATTKSWTLSSGDGTKSVFVQYKDGVGNVSTTAQDAIKLDTTVPSGKVTINGGASITTSRTVTLALKTTDPTPASGVAYMRFRNGGTTTWSNWFTYAASKSWMLTTGVGTKTVYAQFKDRAGNISATASDTITFRP